MQLAGEIILLIGSFFVFLGALGLLRMPDVYNRIQVGTKSVTLGAIGVIIGTLLIHPLWWSKLLVILGLILLTSPVSSSAISRAFYHSGIIPWSKKRKDPGNTDQQEGDK